MPTPLFDAGNRDFGFAIRRNQQCCIDDTVLLRANQLQALKEKNSIRTTIGHMQFWNGTSGAQFVDVQVRFTDRILGELIQDGLNIRLGDWQDNQALVLKLIGNLVLWKCKTQTAIPLQLG